MLLGAGMHCIPVLFAYTAGSACNDSAAPSSQVIARKYVATASTEGQWVLLQNTHLGLGYLAEVEQFLVRADELHEDFR